MIFVVDIDNTVANNQTRMDYILKDTIPPENISMFNSEEMIMQDTPIKIAQMFFQNLKNAKHPIFDQLIFLTGRGENQRKVTEAWLCKNLCLSPRGFILLMRPTECEKVTGADFKKTVIEGMVKLPEFRNQSFTFIDDDVAACKTYSQYGLALRAPNAWFFLVHDLV